MSDLHQIIDLSSAPHNSVTESFTTINSGIGTNLYVVMENRFSIWGTLTQVPCRQE